jgi:hypothetical protein
MPGVFLYLLKRRGIVTNMLKRWWDEFVSVKRQRYISELFEKKLDLISSHPIPSQAWNIVE